MPTECGRYEWDGESVAVYWSNGELLADNGCVCETVDEFDGLCRIDGDGPEAPWSKVGVCCDDECDGDCHKPKQEEP